MARSILKLVSVALILGVVGCAKPEDKGGEHTFVTNGPDRYSDEGGARSQPYFTDHEERAENLPAYQVPEPLRERINQEIPQFAPERSSKFQILNHQLKINAQTSTMTFTGTLKIEGKPDEQIEMSCKFDKSKNWECADMFPVNPDVARERRLQATVNCLDVYNCDKVGLELFVLINGRTESQLFQSGKFEVRRASSGDYPERPRIPVAKRRVDPPAPSPGSPLIQQKPTPQDPSQPEPPPTLIPPGPKPTNRPLVLPEPPAITEEEIKSLMNDPNAAVEVTAPMPVPAPIRGEFSIPDIEKLRPEVGKGVANQAIGAHNDGRLAEAAHLPRNGPGFIARPGRSEKTYGTNSMIELLTQVSAKVAQTVPNKSAILISNISKKIGGRLCNGRSCHASHQSGLDVDVAFPSQKNVNDLWSVCGSNGSNCANAISRDFDAERFWVFAKHSVCAQNSPVIAIFVDTSIKQHMCNFAKAQRDDLSDPNSCGFKALRAMKYAPGHHNHFHMRLKCPGNRDCRNATVSLGRGTGC